MNSLNPTLEHSILCLIQSSMERSVIQVTETPG
jgi:hypothetical protein